MNRRNKIMKNFLWIWTVGSLFLSLPSFAQGLEENEKLPPTTGISGEIATPPPLNSKVIKEEGELLPSGIKYEAHIYCNEGGTCYVISVDEEGIHEEVIDMNKINGGEKDEK